jgi:SAM-dependent methyltransferase
MLCNHCHLIQLKQTTKPELLWNAEYGYRSGINDTMRYELKSIALQAEQLTGLGQEDIVLDIGCNDGTLLDSYSNPNIIRVGYDPSHNVISIADQLLKKYGEDQYSLFTDFFTSLPYNNLFKKKAKVVTAIAMFYDLNDPNTFLKDVCEVLDDDGIFIIQQNYLMGMIQFNAFDNILHEHLEYYSLHSLSNLLKKHNLEVFDVLTNNINGGSFRTLIKKRGAKMKTSEGQENVAKMLKSEKAQGLINKNIYHEFAKNVKENGNRLKDFLTREVKRGKKIYVYGASTRGNTLLQYFGIDHSLVTAAAERNPYKWGKKTVGTNIPIVSETEARNARPDYFLALPWYFRNEFIKRERQYLSQGGKFIFPLPKFEVFHL